MILLIERDGALIRHINDLYRLDDVYIQRQAFVAISLLECYNIIPVIVTSQTVIGHGFINRHQMDDIHLDIEQKLETKLDWFYCPHLPGENCKCCIPKTGLYNEIMGIYNKHSVLGVIHSTKEMGEFAKNGKLSSFKVTKEHDLLHHVVNLVSNMN